MTHEKRPGIGDLWNSGLYEGAIWTELDNPQTSTTAKKAPNSVISWPEALSLHRRNVRAGNGDYHIDAFIHCYIDDRKYDGSRGGIWKNWKRFFGIARHFGGVLGVDFSVYADFPEPVKRYQFHKMRAIEHGAAFRGIPVIPNARWGTRETWPYYYDALPDQSMLSIGTVGSGLRRLENRPMFEAGLHELIRLKHPTALVVVGSDRYPIFEEVRKRDIEVYQYDGPTSAFWIGKGSGSHV